METLDFTALDFETATADRAVCSVGIAVVENARIVRTGSWLVRPPGNRYDWMCQRIHGITPGMTSDAPDFATVWQELRPYLENRIVFAHNALFDMGVLEKSLRDYGIGFPDFRYYCSYRLARKVLNGSIENFKLNTLCRHFGFDLNHHEAESDAIGCARVVIACTPQNDTSIWKGIYGGFFAAPDRHEKNPDRTTDRPGRSYRTVRRSGACGWNGSTSDPLTVMPCRTDLAVNDPEFIRGKRIVVSGTFRYGRQTIEQLIERYGGHRLSTVTSRVDCIVAGENMGPSKRQKAEALGIDILTETEFAARIGGYRSTYASEPSRLQSGTAASARARSSTSKTPEQNG